MNLSPLKEEERYNLARRKASQVSVFDKFAVFLRSLCRFTEEGEFSNEMKGLSLQPRLREYTLGCENSGRESRNLHSISKGQQEVAYRTSLVAITLRRSSSTLATRSSPPNSASLPLSLFLPGGLSLMQKKPFSEGGRNRGAFARRERTHMSSLPSQFGYVILVYSDRSLSCRASY